MLTPSDVISKSPEEDLFVRPIANLPAGTFPTVGLGVDQFLVQPSPGSLFVSFNLYGVIIKVNEKASGASIFLSVYNEKRNQFEVKPTGKVRHANMSTCFF